MLKPLNFEPRFADALPETYALLMSANLTVHPAVSRVTLHGSRGLAGGYRSTSDIDLSLIVDAPQTPDLNSVLQEVLETTLKNWQADIEVDLAVIFDIRKCKLACFEQTRWDERFCQVGGHRLFWTLQNPERIYRACHQCRNPGKVDVSMSEDMAAAINQISYISLNSGKERVIFYLLLTSGRYNQE